MTILDIYVALQAQLKPIGLTVYKEVKPTSEKGNCFVLNSVPISKNNVNTVNDIVVLLYLNKINGMFDKNTAESLFTQVESAVQDMIVSNSLVTMNERLDTNTINLDDTYTVSEFTFRLITY